MAWKDVHVMLNLKNPDFETLFKLHKFFIQMYTYEKRKRFGRTYFKISVVTAV